MESSGGYEVTMVCPDETTEETAHLIVGHMGQYHFVSVEEIESDMCDLSSDHSGAEEETVEREVGATLSDPPSHEVVSDCARWGRRDKASDGSVVIGSCPIDGPLTFFLKLVEAFASIGALLRELATNDRILAILVAVIGLCQRSRWGDAKVMWLTETKQCEKSPNIDCWGDEGTRFFDHLATSSAGSAPFEQTSTCCSQTFPNPFVVKKRRSIHLK